MGKITVDSRITRSDVEALIPVEHMADIVQGVTEGSAALSIMKKLPNMKAGEMKMPVLQSLVTAGFVGTDGGLKPVSKAKWGNKSIVAEEIAVIIPVSENSYYDMSYPLWEQISPLVSQAFGQVIDSAIFFGTDKPATWPEAIVKMAENANNVVTSGTGIDLAEDINQLMGAIENDGFEANGFAAGVGMKGKLRGLRDADKNLLYLPDLQTKNTGGIYGETIKFVKNGSWDDEKALMIAGDFNEAVYSIRQDLSYKLLDQAVITDVENNIIMNLAQQDMIAMRFVMRLGWQVPNPINALNPDEKTRFPFSVLKKKVEG